MAHHCKLKIYTYYYSVLEDGEYTFYFRVVRDARELTCTCIFRWIPLWEMEGARHFLSPRGPLHVIPIMGKAQFLKFYA